MNIKAWTKPMLFLAALIALGASQKAGFTLKGTVAGAKDGDTVLLAEMQGFGMRNLDTTVISNGKFVFEGVQEEPVWRFVICKSGGNPIGSTDLILENGEITADILSKKRNAVNGTANNELWNIFLTATEEQARTLDPFWKIATDSTASEADKAAATKSMENMIAKQEQFKFDFIRQHIKTGVAKILLENLYTNYTLDQLELIYQDLEKVNVKNELTDNIEKHMKSLRKTQIGSHYTDLNLSNENGQKVSLSQSVSKNKVTLIDFWASWCKPCLEEVPHLIAAYKEFKGRGFEIVGISLDQNEVAWKKSITSFGMTWPQMSDLKGWKSIAASEYGVQAIPFTLLVDQEGKIIGKNLRGKELEQKLAELL
ncbi:TlpA disulfide reductase family protein [Sphingobacterium faecium]|uniref:TlpA disulfide reductase family protein n=1 Tax=Sphingobacterium faecium TaxID=34087 RepID=UPI002468D8EE|nr:TlpA disulfide reductase family protein [Sphingobacterium faecium]MDH5826280.1 TlpA disulfide reductase family protein [Sphingobacterium faecium]